MTGHILHIAVKVFLQPALQVLAGLVEINITNPYLLKPQFPTPLTNLCRQQRKIHAGDRVRAVILVIGHRS